MNNTNPNNGYKLKVSVNKRFPTTYSNNEIFEIKSIEDINKIIDYIKITIESSL